MNEKVYFNFSKIGLLGLSENTFQKAEILNPSFSTPELKMLI